MAAALPVAPSLIALGPVGWGILGVLTAGTLAYGVSQMMSDADEEAEKSLSPDIVTEACGTCRPEDEENNKKEEKKWKADDIKDQDKLERQMQQRGWTHKEITEAVESGNKYPATNMKTGGEATRYIHPTTGRSVVIDNSTRGVIHVGGDGFFY